MDEFTDLQPVPQRSGDERRAAAGLRDVSRAAPRDRGTDGRGAGRGAGVLAGIERRAARHHRRRVTGAAALVAAVTAAVAVVVPAVVPGGDGGIVAALGLEDRGASPAPAPVPDPSLAQDGGPASTFMKAGDSMMLTDAQVKAFVTDVQGEAPGVLGNDNADHLPDNDPSLTRGGWCEDADLPVTLVSTDKGAGDLSGIDPGPLARWSATWRGDALARGSVGVGVDETVVKWAFDRPYLSDGEAARSYVDATGSSSVRCDAGTGPDLAGDFEVLPSPLPGAVQAVAPLKGASDGWVVRSVGSAEGSGSAVDLTVVLTAPTAQEAARAVVPLLRGAVDRATAREAVEKAAAEAGTEVKVPPSSTAPQRVVVRPYGMETGGLALTKDQVAAVLPGVVTEQQPPGVDHPTSSRCIGPFGAPDASTDNDARSERVSGFEVQHDGGTTVVAQWGMEWTPSSASSGSALFGLDPACGPAPAGEEWEPVTLSHAGVDVPVIVRHPGGDAQQWVVRATAAVEPAAAVGLQIQMTAPSRAQVAAVVVPLLQAAQQRAYDANFVPSTP